MCTLTIDCRCDTCIDGITRYQWPRIIAVQAPPSIAAEVRKLATVSACDRRASAPAETSIACSTTATRPPPTASADDRGPDRRERSGRPSPSSSTSAASERRRAPAARSRSDLRTARRRPRRTRRSRNASAIAIRIAASPALKRKNFTPASRETNASVKTMPTPRCARKRKRTVDRDMRRADGLDGQDGLGSGGSGPDGAFPPTCPPAYPAYPPIIRAAC